MLIGRWVWQAAPCCSLCSLEEVCEHSLIGSDRPLSFWHRVLFLCCRQLVLHAQAIGGLRGAVGSSSGVFVAEHDAAHTPSHFYPPAARMPSGCAPTPPLWARAGCRLAAATERPAAARPAAATSEEAHQQRATAAATPAPFASTIADPRVAPILTTALTVDSSIDCQVIYMLHGLPGSAGSKGGGGTREMRDAGRQLGERVCCQTAIGKREEAGSFKRVAALQGTGMLSSARAIKEKARGKGCY